MGGKSSVPNKKLAPAPPPVLLSDDLEDISFRLPTGETVCTYGIEVPADGWCLFHAAGWLFNIDPSEVLRVVYRFAETHHLTRDRPDFLRKLRHMRWTEFETTIPRIIAELYGQIVIVVSVDYNIVYVFNPHGIPVRRPDNTLIFLHRQNQYTPLVEYPPLRQQCNNWMEEEHRVDQVEDQVEEYQVEELELEELEQELVQRLKLVQQKKEWKRTRQQVKNDGAIARAFAME